MACRKNPHAVALGARTSSRKRASSRANGQRGGRPPEWQIIDGTPVPYSLTVQRRTKDGTYETVKGLTPALLTYVTRWLYEHKPQMHVTRSQGGYVYYELS